MTHHSADDQRGRIASGKPGDLSRLVNVQASEFTDELGGDQAGYRAEDFHSFEAQAGRPNSAETTSTLYTTAELETIPIPARNVSTMFDAASHYERIENKSGVVQFVRRFLIATFSVWAKLSSFFVRKARWVQHVEPYVGYGTGRYSRLICRTVYGPANRPIRGIRRGIRGMLTIPAPHVPVSIDIDGIALQTVQVGSTQQFDQLDATRSTKMEYAFSDCSGYLDLLAERRLKPGIHKVTYRVKGRKPVVDELFTIEPSTQVGVISDVDDTIMITQVPTVWKAAYNMLLLSPKKRSPVPGMNVLYNKIADLFPEAPFFYLSTSPWNVEGSIRHFIADQGYPNGPLLLRDLDPRPKTFVPDGVQHKLEYVEQLMTDFPDMKFILIGDDGQKDPTTYATIARRYPGRVLAIGIRQLSMKETPVLPLPGVTGAVRQPVPVTQVPVFMGTTGSNLMNTMLPYLRRFT